MLPYVNQAKQYSTECGCAMGAKFLAVALGIFVIYFISAHNFEFINILKQLALGMLFLFAASTAGKFIGIGLARIRLAMLYRQLAQKFPNQGDY